jgi:hypothetical protein
VEVLTDRSGLHAVAGDDDARRSRSRCSDRPTHRHAQPSRSPPTEAYPRDPNGDAPHRVITSSPVEYALDPLRTLVAEAVRGNAVDNQLLSPGSSAPSHVRSTIGRFRAVAEAVRPAVRSSHRPRVTEHLELPGRLLVLDETGAAVFGVIWCALGRVAAGQRHACWLGGSRHRVPVPHAPRPWSLRPHSPSPSAAMAEVRLQGGGSGGNQDITLPFCWTQMNSSHDRPPQPTAGGCSLGLRQHIRADATQSYLGSTSGRCYRPSGRGPRSSQLPTLTATRRCSGRRLDLRSDRAASPGRSLGLTGMGRGKRLAAGPSFNRRFHIR